MNSERVIERLVEFQTKWFKVFRKKIKNDVSNKIEDFFTIERSNFVLLVAVQQSNIFLVKQFRAGPEKDYIALPAGYIEAGETLEAAANRELAEETKMFVDNWKKLGELYALPGYINSIGFVMYGEIISSTSEDYDSAEISEIIKVPIQKALKMIETGEINEMQAVAAILLANRLIFNQ